MSQRFARFGPLAGVAFVALMVIGFVLAGSSPDPDAKSPKIAHYLSDSSSYHKNIASLFVLLAAMLFLIGFLAALRSRLVEAGHAPGAGALAFGAGIASTVFLVIAIILFISPSIAAHDAASGHATIDPGIYRATQDLGYPIWVASTAAGALVAWATAAVTLGTGILPRWFGWLSVAIGIICLFGIFFFPILIFWLWILVASIVLFLRPAPIAVAPGRL
jgi:hypothetical protein